MSDCGLGDCLKYNNDGELDVRLTDAPGLLCTPQGMRIGSHTVYGETVGLVPDTDQAQAGYQGARILESGLYALGAGAPGDKSLTAINVIGGLKITNPFDTDGWVQIRGNANMSMQWASTGVVRSCGLSLEVTADGERWARLHTVNDQRDAGMVESTHADYDYSAYWPLAAHAMAEPIFRVVFNQNGQNLNGQNPVPSAVTVSSLNVQWLVHAG